MVIGDRRLSSHRNGDGSQLEAASVVAESVCAKAELALYANVVDGFVESS